MALTYQWYKDGSPISGATSATYTKPSAVEGDAGSYYCRVTNAFGSVNSNAATVTVDANTLLLVQVDATGNIVERTGNGTIITNGTVIIDPTTTYDGYGSIRNTAVGNTIATGYTSIFCNIALTGNFTIEGYFNPLSPLSRAGWMGNQDGNTTSQFALNVKNSSTFMCFGGNSSSNTGILSSQFYHNALVREGSVIKWYRDGQYIVNITGYSYQINITELRLGKDNDYNGGGVASLGPCCWENIRVSNIARYTENFTPPERF